MKQMLTLILTLAAFPALAQEMSLASINCSAKTPAGKAVKIVQSYEIYSGTLTQDSKLTVLVDGQRPENLSYESATVLYVSPYGGEFIGLLLSNEAGEAMVTIEHVATGNEANQIRIMNMLLTDNDNAEDLGQLVALKDVSCTIDRGDF